VAGYILISNHLSIGTSRKFVFTILLKHSHNNSPVLVVVSFCRSLIAADVDDLDDVIGEITTVDDTHDPDANAGRDMFGSEADMELDQSERIVINVSGLRVETRLEVRIVTT